MTDTNGSLIEKLQERCRNACGHRNSDRLRDDVVARQYHAGRAAAYRDAIDLARENPTPDRSHLTLTPEQVAVLRSALERANGWIMDLMKMSPDVNVYEPIGAALAILDEADTTKQEQGA